MEVVPGNFVSMTYMPEDDTVRLDVVMPKDTWFGLTLGESSMSDVDMIYFETEQTGTVGKFTDAYGQGYGMPGVDSQQDWTGDFTEGDQYEFSIVRSRQANDSSGKDFTFPLDEQFECGFAASSADGTMNEMHDSFGAF